MRVALVREWVRKKVTYRCPTHLKRILMIFLSPWRLDWLRMPSLLDLLSDPSLPEHRTRRSKPPTVYAGLQNCCSIRRNTGCFEDIARSLYLHRFFFSIVFNRDERESVSSKENTVHSVRFNVFTVTRLPFVLSWYLVQGLPKKTTVTQIFLINSVMIGKVK